MREDGPTSADDALAAWRALDASVLARLAPDGETDGGPDGETSGDPVKQRLLHPALLRLAGPVDGRDVLDVGAGIGDLSRRLVRRGARVTALEPSPVLAEHLRTLDDVTVVEAELGRPESVAGQGFDVVLASLVLCVVPDLRGAVRACVDALRPGGTLVVAVEHPCFEQSLRDWTRTGVARVNRYLSEYEIPGAVAPDFHRPLSTYLTELLAAGLAIEAVEEPQIDEASLDDFPFLAPLRELPLFLLVAARRSA